MKTRQTIKILMITLCLFGHAAVKIYAQNVIGQIDSLTTMLNERNELSGSILVAIGGETIYKRSFGYADVANKVLNSDSSSFKLASLSKPFTAIAILQLKEKGKLKLDDAVIKYLPDFPYNNITIRQLLSHTSGLVDLQIFEAPYKADTNKIFSNADLIPAIRADKNAIIAQPGEKYSYSNTGFGILVLIVEKVTAMPFQDYLAKYIFKPAQMFHTYVNSRLINVNPGDKNRTKNYDFLSYAPWQLRMADSMKRYKIALINLGGMLGDDNVISTTGDLLHFDRALYTAKLLKLSTLQEAFTPTKLNNGRYAICGWQRTRSYYGLGWMILCDTTTNGKIVFHSGGDIGAVTIFLRNITRNQSVILLDNVTHRGVHGTGIDIMRLLNNQTVHPDKQSLAKIYAGCLFEKGADNAASRFNELKGDTANYYMSERELNSLGLDLLYDGHQTEGAEALKLNTILYPGSWNVYDSYGEALAKTGKKEEATEMYKKSIIMNPKNDGGKKALDNLKSK